MIPINTVNASGYMWNKFELQPGMTTFATKLYSSYVLVWKVKVSSALLSGMQSFVITTDGWTSRSNCSYISFAVHYKNKD